MTRLVAALTVLTALSGSAGTGCNSTGEHREADRGEVLRQSGTGQSGTGPPGTGKAWDGERGEAREGRLGDAPESGRGVARPPGAIPLDGPHHYRVTWMGLHCGDMTLESAAVEGKPALVRMVMTVSSTELFDRIYRVRSRIESLYNVRLGSTRRYHEQTTEKDRTKEDLWLVDARSGQARRTRNGVVQEVEIPRRGVHDPLAMLYRFRAQAREAGDVASVTVMTTRGAIEARAEAERWEQFKGSSGEIQALKVVQQPVADQEFGRGGGLTMWLSSDEMRVPHRIDFDLPFGKLVAELVAELAPEQKRQGPR